MKIKNLLNAMEFPRPELKNDQLSLTIPDQTMSMRTILDRYARGLSISGKEPVFEGDEPIPDFRKMDLSEIEDLRNENQMLIEKHNKKLKKIQETQQKQKLYDQLRNEFENDKKPSGQSVAKNEAQRNDSEAIDRNIAETKTPAKN